MFPPDENNKSLDNMCVLGFFWFEYCYDSSLRGHETILQQNLPCYVQYNRRESLELELRYVRLREKTYLQTNAQLYFENICSNVTRHF